MGCQRGQRVRGEEKILGIGAGMGGNGGVKLMVSLGTSLGGGGLYEEEVLLERSSFAQL